jgi:hypothetical protein
MKVDKLALPSTPPRRGFMAGLAAALAAWWTAIRRPSKTTPSSPPLDPPRAAPAREAPLVVQPPRDSVKRHG